MAAALLLVSACVMLATLGLSAPLMLMCVDTRVHVRTTVLALTLVRTHTPVTALLSSMGLTVRKMLMSATPPTLA